MTFDTPSGTNLAVNGSISGSGSLAKDGSGTLALDAPNTYTGGTTVNGGMLDLNYGTGSAAGTIRGVLNINSGATVELNAPDAMGYTVTGLYVTTVNIDGGTIDNATGYPQAYTADFFLTGGTMSSSGGGAYDFTNGYGITTYASATTSVISSNIDLSATATT